jgi:hypothetical protein
VASFAGALEALEYRTWVAMHLSLALLPVATPTATVSGCIQEPREFESIKEFRDEASVPGAIDADISSSRYGIVRLSL